MISMVFVCLKFKQTAGYRTHHRQKWKCLRYTTINMLGIYVFLCMCGLEFEFIESS